MVKESDPPPEVGRLRLRSPAHGFCDDAPTRRLLRSRPPRSSLTWVEEQLRARVVLSRAMRGGMSSAVHVLTLETSGGAHRPVVLRRYVRPEINAESPDIAAREARTLRFAEEIDVPTPQLLAVDPTGTAAGVPAVLMSRVPGRVDWWPRNAESWLRHLAELLPRIHAAPLPPAGTIRGYRPYPQSSYEPPPWTHRPKVWERAIEIFHHPPPALPPAFIQRDYHPGNVLWSRGAVSGVVDWQSASIGPAAVDVGHCRANLLGYGQHAVERFTHLWEQAAGMTYHPWSDVVTLIGFLDDLRGDWGSDRLAVEAMLAAAVSELNEAR